MARELSIFDNYDYLDEEAIELLEQAAERPALFALLDTRFFPPEDWLSNLDELEPIFLPDPRLNRKARQLLLEIYRSFAFGSWPAVFAISRSVLESALCDRLPTLVPKLEIRNSGKGRLTDDYKRLDYTASVTAASPPAAGPGRGW